MIVEEMPDYLVREKELKKFLTENIQYQQIAKENRIQGKVYVKFVVNEQDMVTNAEILRGVDTNLDKEVLRVINSMQGLSLQYKAVEM